MMKIQVVSDLAMTSQKKLKKHDLCKETLTSLFASSLKSSDMKNKLLKNETTTQRLQKKICKAHISLTIFKYTKIF